MVMFFKEDNYIFYNFHRKPVVIITNYRHYVWLIEIINNLEEKLLET